MSDEITLVTGVQVREWAVSRGLVSAKARGRVPKRAIEEYEAAHPNHLYSKFAHGRGGYDMGCRCDECKIAKGVNPNWCRDCHGRKTSVTIASNEVRRIARAMSRSPRNVDRLRPSLEAAKAHLAAAKESQATHQRECGT
jgi:hypothetical protein